MIVQMSESRVRQRQELMTRKSTLITRSCSPVIIFHTFRISNSIVHYFDRLVNGGGHNARVVLQPAMLQHRYAQHT